MFIFQKQFFLFFTSYEKGIDCTSDIEIYNRYLTDSDFIHTIHTKDQQFKFQSFENLSQEGGGGVKGKKKIVCLHGYWSSNLAFVKLLKPLSKDFEVYSLDLPGQALSSRGDFDCDSAEQIINYFTDSLEFWREKEGLENFDLVGHSFGGYLAGFYALKYPERVNNLILLSPAGIKHEKNLEKVHEGIVYFVLKSQGVFKQFFFHAFDSLWKMNKTVSGMYQKPFFPGQWLLNNYLNSHLQNKVNENLFSKWHQYYDGIMSLPVCSEKAMTGVLNFPSFSAKIPLENLLSSPNFQKHSIPVHFFFGDSDWMEFETAQKLIQQKLVQGTFSIVPNSGHKIAYDNPQAVIQHLLEINSNFLQKQPKPCSNQPPSQ